MNAGFSNAAVLEVVAQVEWTTPRPYGSVIQTRSG